jgi:hypothetical protein
VELEESTQDDGYYNMFSLWATDAAGNTSEHRSLNIKLDATPPEPPGKPAFVRGSVQEVELSWSASPSLEAVGYNLYRSTISGSQYIRVNDVMIAELRFTDTDNFGDLHYYYCLTALDPATLVRLKFQLECKRAEATGRCI